MMIRRFLPSVSLAPYVKEYVIIESTHEAINKTLPDTAMVIGFRYKGSITRVEGVHQELLSGTTVAGIRKTVRHFQYAKGTGNLLVVLKEGGFSFFSRIPAHEFFASSAGAENIFPRSELNEIVENLGAAPTDDKRIQFIEGFFKKKLTASQDDVLITHALAQIKHCKGVIRVKDVASSLCISQDPFEKRFRAKVGCSPKQYASIVRLRTLLANYSATSRLTESSYAAGYFDQSHFIKDFKLFTGQSPKDFFKSPLYW